MRVLSIAHGESTLTFGGSPNPPLTLTFLKSSDGLMGLGVGVGVALALGLADAAGVVAAGEALGEAPPSSSPHAPRSSDALNPRMTKALAEKECTDEPYRPLAVPTPI